MTTARSRSYQRIASRYEAARGGLDRALQLAAIVNEQLSPATRLCDVGVGTGIVAQQLRDAGHDVTGVDISTDMLRQASERLPGRVAVADASGLPFRDACLGAVALVWVLHHVGDPDAAFRETRRVLEPGGRLVVISGLADEVGDDIDPIFRGLDFELRPERASHSALMADLAVAAGLEVMHRGTGVVTMTTTPNGLAQSIEDRMYAPLWELDDDRWKSVVQPALRALRALPEPDRPRTRAVPHPVWVWSRPS